MRSFFNLILYINLQISVLLIWYLLLITNLRDNNHD